MRSESQGCTVGKSHLNIRMQSCTLVLGAPDPLCVDYTLYSIKQSFFHCNELAPIGVLCEMSLPMMFCARHTHALISIYGRSEQCWLLVDRLEASISDDSVEGVPLSSLKELLEALDHACNALRWRCSAHVHLRHRLRLCEPCADTGDDLVCILRSAGSFTLSKIVLKVCGLHLLLLRAWPASPARCYGRMRIG